MLKHIQNSSRGKKVQKIQEERTMSEGYENKKNGGREPRFWSSHCFRIFSIQVGQSHNSWGGVDDGHPMSSVFKTNSLVHTVQRKIQISNLKYKYKDSPYRMVISSCIRYARPNLKSNIRTLTIYENTDTITNTMSQRVFKVLTHPGVRHRYN